jgi:RHH-type proline utilization regulon transcriptional repressor/proline dehydrogenase/delta 1-pyrroline-5-carboxylate dehydrogenase
VGAALVADARVQGVLFTGSTEVARLLQRTLAQRLDARGRPVTLVAETGGQNALFVDSSALPEQVVADVLASAFDSAGQRCSALRVLCVQDDIATRLLHMLEGAMRELRLGDPRRLAVDVGPLIDEQARSRIAAHVEAMRARGRRVVQPSALEGPAATRGVFYPPTLIEIEDLRELEHEVFGPVLHVLRHRRDDLPEVLEQVRATGYGLTMGVHTRIDETVAQVVQASIAGNLYVNRNIVGAVVGVQPFGGDGLSGTGPKAGGPLYLLRLLSDCPPQAPALAVEGAGPRADSPVRGLPAGPGPASPQALEAVEAMEALQALQAWLTEQRLPDAAQACRRHAEQAPDGAWRALSGPTGEANVYAVRPREGVLCLADDDTDRLVQLGAVLATGGHALWPAGARSQWERLPRAVRARITLVDDWQAPRVALDAALHHGPPEQCLAILQALARRPGPIIGLTAMRSGQREVPLARLLSERSLSVNTAAAGGNASLMTLD